MEEKEQKKEEKGLLKTIGKAITAGVVIYGIKTSIDIYCTLKKEQRRAKRNEEKFPM